MVAQLPVKRLFSQANRASIDKLGLRWVRHNTEPDFELQKPRNMLESLVGKSLGGRMPEKRSGILMLNSTLKPPDNTAAVSYSSISLASHSSPDQILTNSA